MRTKGSAQGGARERFVVTEAERRVLDLPAANAIDSAAIAAPTTVTRARFEIRVTATPFVRVTPFNAQEGQR